MLSIQNSIIVFFGTAKPDYFTNMSRLFHIKDI